MAPTPRRRRTRRLFLWIGGLLVTALTTVITGALAGIPGQIFDVEAAKDRVRPGPDFRHSVEVINLDQGFSVAVPGRYRMTPLEARLARKLDAVSASELDRELRAHGGVDLRNLTLRIVLEGRRNQEIRVLDMRPVALKRTAPVSGTLFYIPPQGSASTMRMIVDLDDAVPVLRTAVLREEVLVGARPFFEEKTIRLRDRERDVLLIRATAERYSVSFKLEVDYLVGAQRKRVVIDNRGRPFRVTGMSCSATRGLSAYTSSYSLGDGPHGFELVKVADPPRFPGACGRL